MEIEVLSRKSERKAVIEATANFYANRLNITKSKYKVFILFDPNMSKDEGMNGVCAKTGDKEITIALCSKLPDYKLFTTLAHEMVHVKQICRGQYSSKILRNGRVAHYWCGQRINAQYTDRPWEREAFMREGLLTRYLSDEVEKYEKTQQKGKKRV